MSYISIEELAEAEKKKKLKDGYYKIKVKNNKIIELSYESKLKKIEDIIEKEES